MNTNKAPDKIYLPVVEEEGKRLLSTIWWPEDNRPSNEKFVVDAIPYIRKEALLEWLNERYKSTILNVGCYTGHSVWAEVIEHINEM